MQQLTNTFNQILPIGTNNKFDLIRLSLLNCLLCVLMCLTYLRALHVHVFDVLACLRAWHACVLACLTCLRACLLPQRACLFYFLTRPHVTCLLCSNILRVCVFRIFVCLSYFTFEKVRGYPKIFYIEEFGFCSEAYGVFFRSKITATFSEKLYHTCLPLVLINKTHFFIYTHFIFIDTI